MAKILYFVDGNPTSAQSEEAEKLGAVLRNARIYHDGDFIEQCDFVVGEYPEAYAHLARHDEPVDDAQSEEKECWGKGKK